ncbi:MAG: hypothetical protein ABUL68_00065 [Pseudomonadota bacterium]
MTASSGTTAFTSADNATATPVVVDSGLTFTDPSLAVLDSNGAALVSIAANYQSGTDFLAFNNTSTTTFGNITGLFVPNVSFAGPAGTLVLTLPSGSTATLGQWQSALNAITFTSTAANPNTAPRTISFKIYDGVQFSTPVSKTVTVTAVNQTPIVTTSTGATSFFVSGSAVPVDSGLTVSDGNNATLASAQITISNFQAGAEAVLFANNPATMGNIAGAYVTTNGVTALVLTSPGATATLAQWQAALRSVTYFANTAATTGSRTIAFIVNDGTTNSAAATKTVTVSPQAVIASVTAPAGGTYKAGDALLFTVTFSSAVTVTGTPSITVTIGSATRTATYVAGSSPTTTLTFRYTVQLGDNATGGIAVASPIVLNQGSISGGGSVAAGLTFTPPTTTSILVITAPVLTASAGNTVFTAGDNVASTPVPVDPGITLTDPSSATLASATILLPIVLPTEDILGFINTSTVTYGNISGSYMASTGTLTLTSAGATATVAQWQAALRAVTYNNSAITPSPGDFPVNFTVRDTVQSSNTVTKTISPIAVDQTTVVTPGSVSSIFVATLGPIAVDSGVTVSDRDNATLSSATVSITGNFRSTEDVLAFTNTSTTTYGNIAGNYNSASGVLALTSTGATATVAQWQAALRVITYNDTSIPPNTLNRTVSFTVNDGKKDSAVKPKLITVISSYATTTTASAASATFSTTNQTVSLSAGVTSSGGTVNTGTVTFTLKNSSGSTVGTAVTSGTVTNGVATASYTLPAGTAAGIYTIQAAYGGAAPFDASGDSTRSLTVGAASTTVMASAPSVTFGSAAKTVTLTANVTSPGGTVNGGTVTFTLKNSLGATVGTAVTSGTVTNGSATANYILPAGTAVSSYTIQAVYNAAGSFTTSSASGATLTVSAAATATTASGRFSVRTITNEVYVIADGSGSWGPVGVAASGDGSLFVGTLNYYYVTRRFSPNSATDKSPNFGGNSLILGASDPMVAEYLPADGSWALYLYDGPNALTSGGPYQGGISKLSITTDSSLGFATATKLTGSYVIQGGPGLGMTQGGFLTNGFIYFTQTDQILAVPKTGGTVITVIPSGSGLSKTTGLIKSNAFGNLLYVAETGGSQVFMVDLFTKTVTSLTSKVAAGVIESIGGLAVDASGNVYVACKSGIKIFGTDGTVSDYFLASTPVKNGSKNVTVNALGNLVFGGDGSLYFTAVGGNDNVLCSVAARNVISLAASVTSSVGTVTDGTVKFTLLDGSTAVGTPVTVSVTNGAASTPYALPAGQTAASYTIQAEYIPATSGAFAGSTDKSATLTPTAQQKNQIALGTFASVAGLSLRSSDYPQAAATAAASSLGAVLYAGGTSGTLVGYIAGINAGFVVDISINDDNTFGGQTKALTSSTGTGQTLTFSGSIANGVMTGTVAELGLSFTANVDPAAGASAASAGLYQASSLNAGGGATYSIVGTQSQVFVLALAPGGVSAGTGTVSGTGTYTVATAQGTSIAGTVTATGSTSATITLSGGSTIGVSGLSTAVPVTHRVANVSGLGTVGGGQAITEGFVISGPKTVLLRAIGPGLSQLGVPGVQATPILTLYDGTGKPVVTNSGWAGDSTLAADFSQVGAFSLGTTSRDAAVVTTLPPGIYTMQVTGGTSAGLALAEIYDLDPILSPLNSNLLNGSSLGSVVGSTTVMTAGFVIDGNSPRNVLIRGIGPSLGQLGVTNPLAAPLIKLYDGTRTVIAQNQVWGTPVTVGTTQTPATASAIASAAGSVGAFPLATGSNDSSLIVTLPPGSYTVQVSGANNASGTALIEIYVF